MTERAKSKRLKLETDIVSPPIIETGDRLVKLGTIHTAQKGPIVTVVNIAQGGGGSEDNEHFGSDSSGKGGLGPAEQELDPAEQEKRDRYSCTRVSSLKGLCNFRSEQFPHMPNVSFQLVTFADPSCPS